MKVCYIYDENLEFQSNKLPVMPKRASIVHDLISSYEILASDVTVVKSTPATENELKDFHSTDFVQFLKKLDECEDLEMYEEEQEEFGLSYDCPLVENHYQFVSTIAGGTLTAAHELCENCCDIAINWFGGWHHAQRSEAEGFCYVNDIVLGIQRMLKVFKRVLYVDLDVHHGNGVQNAFEVSKRVLTLSFHKKVAGFYPGSGSLEEIGLYNGRFYSINVPFLEGIGDKTYLQLFRSIFPKIFEAFDPYAIVVQCGGDILMGDPVGQCNVTLKAMGQCFQDILDKKKPCLVLGGGGYNFANTARYWTYLTSIVAGKVLDEDIPDNSQFFKIYGPTYELNVNAGNQKDCNTSSYIDNVVSTIEEYCRHISADKQN